MKQNDLGADAGKAVQEVLGYLNYSSGTPDPRFLANINHLFERVNRSVRDGPAWQALGRLLAAGLDDLRGRSEVFRHADQAAAVLGLVFDKALPAYCEYHRDLLFHQSDETLFQPLFVGRMCEVVLRHGPWDDGDRVVRDALLELNDYMGHRLVAVLRTQQKIQPYAHEWVRPVPLWIRGAGVAYGRYHEVVERALAILEATDGTLLFESMFDPGMLEELAFDPRAYDFDHPVNKRPNYLFGQWDMGRLDNSGRCRRFVVQQVSIDAMLDRIEHRGNLPYEEVLFEAGAVLAGTMLMGSGVSGNRPEAHDSSVTLSTLVEQIALYRDAFYEQLLGRMSGPHGERLRAEAASLRQPFGGARQHFNHHLARRRAEQLQHVHLAEVFARMGYTEAAARQVRMVPVASARMRCDIHCRLATAQRRIGQSRRSPASAGRGAGQAAAKVAQAAALQEATDLLAEAEDLLHRGIECGALVDPWNILGFGGQYSLFPSPENSVYDHRVDELIDVVSGIFAVYVQAQKEAAAASNIALEHVVSARMESLADWWDKYASTEVSSIEGISGQETRESAEHVSAALRAWHEAGTAAGDLAFWRSRAEQFRSAKSYALVVDALLEQRDPVAAMALLVQWLSQAAEISLVEEDYSFHDLALDWMAGLWEDAEAPEVAPSPPGQQAGGRTRKGPRSNPRRRQPADSDAGPEEIPAPRAPRSATPLPEEKGREGAAIHRWQLSRKFFDYLEANADEYWEVPQFELGVSNPQAEAEEEEESDGLFEAAYEDVTYRDSTDDGFEGEMLEGGLGGEESATDFELVLEAERIIGRLKFLDTLAELWKLTAVAAAAGGIAPEALDLVFSGWLGQAVANCRRLSELLAAVHHYRIPAPRGTHESLVEYDRRRGVKETLLEQIMATCLETSDAARMLRVLMGHSGPASERDDWEEPTERALRALLRGDAAAVRRGWRDLRAALSHQPLLYVALARGGNPQRIVASRGLQMMLRRLLAYLPRLGLLRETRQLLETIHEMEASHPVGPGAITEFDQLFRIGCKSIVRCLVASAQSWSGPDSEDLPGGTDAELIAYLEQVVETLLHPWLVHSRGVRLSVLEAVDDKDRWHQLKLFIERYGHDIFTQRFMNLGNLRAILHEGAEAYLEALGEEPGVEEQFRLLRELDGAVSHEEAVRWLTIIIEAIVENYSEYVDYNSTTTQSDRGEMLYTLLDYLRLQASYDRLAWNLLPVVLAHEVVVRSGHEEAANIWRSAVAERTASIADSHLKRFARLNRKYGMRLPSIADRLGERFVRPLMVDRLRAMVRPAIDEIGTPSRPAGKRASARRRSSESSGVFARLEAGIRQFTREVSGAGFDVPSWLEALEEEVDRVQSGATEDDDLPDPLLSIPQIALSREEIRRQVQAIGRE